jgi:two-component system sensor histidine kinase GlrK
MANVRHLYPRSLLRLILLGNVIVALPLLAAVAYVAGNIGALTERSEALTRDASRAALLGWELPEDLGTMERILRQYEVLGDESLLDDYGAARREWVRVGGEYAAIPLLAELRGRISVLLEVEAAGYEAFLADQKRSAEIRRELVQLRSRAHDLRTEAGHLTDREVAYFREQAELLRQRLLLALALGLSAVVLFVAFSRFLFSRVLRGFEQAVVALGEGQLEREIHLDGPEDIQEVGRRLDWLRRRLLALEEQRILGLRHVSHELKTPLAALREGASLLTEGAAGSLTPAQEKIVGIMCGNSLRLQGLIDSLLKLQQAGHAGDRIEPVRLRFDELVQQVVTTHQLAARSKRLRFSGALAPLTVSGGREELTTVVDNLLSNAIKFSPEGSSVEVTLTRQNELVVLDVADQGPGVPAGERDQIFEPFYRSANARSIAGVGLGLAIAREFAVAHRGTLELLDAPVGARFRLTLPLTRGIQ